MTVTRHPGYELRGESADTKPTTGVITNYSTFLENNTGKRYYWTGTEWVYPEFQKLKEYNVFTVGSTTYITERSTGRVANSNTDTQIAWQAVVDSMVHGDHFVFYWDGQRFTLFNPLAVPKSTSFTTLKAITMKGWKAHKSSGASVHGTQFVYGSTFPNQRYAIEGLAQDADVNEYIVLDMDGFSFDNRAYGRAWELGALNKNIQNQSSPIIDAGAMRIRNASSYGSHAINIRNIHSMFVWRTLHLEGAVVSGTFENFYTEDDTGDPTAAGAFVGDSLILLQSLQTPTVFNATPKYNYFSNFKRFGQGRYNNWLRMRSGNYNTFIDIFPDGGLFEEAVFNLDNTQDVALDSGHILASNAFYHLQTLDTNFNPSPDNRKGGTLYLNGSSCVSNKFSDCLLTNYPNMVKIANGAARNTVEIDGFLTTPALIDDVGAGVGNTIILQGGHQVGGSDSPAKTTAGIVRLVDLRAVAFSEGDELISDGTHWWLKGPPSMLSKRKWGRLAYGVTAATTNVGMLATLITPTGAGTITISNDSTNGRYINCPTLGTSGNKGGLRINASLMISAFDPKFRVRFKLVDTTNVRLFLGLMSNNEPTSDDPLGAGSVGMMLGLKAADTNFRWFRNNTTGATVDTDTGVAKDTNVHEVKIAVTGGGTTFSVSLDNAAYTNYTTEIPGTSNILTPTIIIETAEAVAKTFQIYDAMLQIEK